MGQSVGVVTALMPVLGYARSTRLAKEALGSGSSVRDLVLREGLISAEVLDELLAPAALSGLQDTGPLPPMTAELLARIERELDEADRHDDA